MANEVFLDTNGWLGLLNADDVNHLQAASVWRDLGRSHCRIVVTDWVIAEAGNGMARGKSRERFVNAVDRVWKSPNVALVVVDRQLIVRAVEFYQRYDDKNWGLVDCASFLVMQDHGITDAFTSDRHFEQAGFNCLLKA